MKTISLPGGPFFCANDGRYLPSLTPFSEMGVRSSEFVQALSEVEIEFAAMEQRMEIEETLLKLRLRARCFLALAALSPQSVVAGLEAEKSAAVTDAPLQVLDFPAGAIGSDQGEHEMNGPISGDQADLAGTRPPDLDLTGCIQDEELKRSEGQTHPLPARSTDQVASGQFLQSRGTKASIKVFPGSLSEQLKMKGDW